MIINVIKANGKRLPGRHSRDHSYNICFKQWQGFNLIELLIVMAIITVLGGLGIPSLRSGLQRSAEAATLNTLSHLATFARNRAIKEQTFFTLCPSVDLRHCQGEWNKTLIVFSDGNRNERLDEGERLYQTLTLAKGTPCLEWRASAGRQYVQFKSSGATNGTAGHFRFCEGTRSVLNKRLVISFNGRTSLKTL